MSFLKTAEQVAGGTLCSAEPVFNPAEVLSVLYETRPESIAKILPPPLVPYKKPYVIVAYNNFRDVNFDAGFHGPGYKETALYVPAVYDGVVGTFVAAMTLDTDMGIFLGREKYGYPKKMGIIDHNYDGNRYVAYSARHGIPYCILDAELDGTPNDPTFQAEMAEVLCSDPNRPGFAINWTYKWTPGENGNCFASKPKLVKGWKSKRDLGIPSKIGHAKVTYIPSEDDPWYELEPIHILGATLVTVESRMYCVDAEYIPVDEAAFQPYAFFGWDLKTGF